MKENKYDDETFFNIYSGLERSRKGLAGAGEWPALCRLFPDLKGKTVLDIGCGFGWHERYMVENGAGSVIAADISHRMLERARRENGFENVTYLNTAMEDLEFDNDSFDMVFSSLAMHYTSEYRILVARIHHWLKDGGVFLFSTEHPVFTSTGNEDWLYGPDGNILCFPVDGYFMQGKRKAVFLKQEVVKYHRTLTEYVNTLIDGGFAIEKLVEPEPEAGMLADPVYRNELRRPQMLIIRAVKV